MKKNLIKILGNILAILAIVFVIQRFFEFDIDYSVLFNIKSICFILIFSLLYAFSVFLAGLPWKKFIYVFTGCDIPFSEVTKVWSKSNVLKYLPGNVFQYIGRNQIAVTHKLDHLLVVCCTILEILFNIFGFLIVGVILYFPGFMVYWNEYFKEFISDNLYIIALLIVFIVFITFFILKFSVKYTNVIKNIFNTKNIKIYIFSALYYICVSLYSSLIYIGVLIFILDLNFLLSDLLIIMGAFSLSWIVGFITPGAPGGIGVRELALSLILAQLFNMEVLMFGIVIYRIINIFGDILGLTYSNIYYKIKEYN